MPLSIAYNELFPVIIASSLWGHRYSSLRMEFHSDKRTVVDVLRSGTLRDPYMMALLRRLSLLAAIHSFSFTASSVAGVLNPVANALSHFDLQKFHHLAPQATLESTPIPGPLLEELRVL